MDSINASTRLESRKRIIRKAGFIFLLIIILLTFFSKTINNFLMPEVECQSPSAGSLQTGVKAAGTVRTMNVEKMFAYGSWDITDVKVKEGDEVTKGTILAAVEAEDIALDKKTRELEVMRLENSLQQYRESFNEASRQAAIKNLLEGLDKAQKELEQVTDLYNSGSETRKAVDEAQDRLDSAKSSYETALKEFDNAKAGYERSIKEKELELQLKKLEYENVIGKMPADGNIKAPVDGIVKTVGVEKGMSCSAGQVIFEIGRKTSAVTVEWQLNSEKAAAVNVGDKARFKIKSLDNTSIEGVVKEKQYSANTGMYFFSSEINVEDKNPGDGCEAEVSITKSSANYQFVVPKSAISGQEGKEYVFVVNERGGVLGQEHYVTSVDVKVEESDDFNSAVTGTLDSEDEIVIFSSKALTDGAQVKLR